MHRYVCNFDHLPLKWIQNECLIKKQIGHKMISFMGMADTKVKINHQIYWYIKQTASLTFSKILIIPYINRL